MKRLMRIFCVALILFALLIGGSALIGYRYYAMMRHQVDNEEIAQYQETVVEFETDDAAVRGENASQEEIDQINAELEQNLLDMADSEMSNEDIFNLLVIGVDSRQKDFLGRSDVMLLLTFNKKNQKLVMASLLRDSYVAISGYDNNRLNAAYAFGGTQLLYNTIKANYGIDVDHSVVVNFYLVMDMVDAVGGVDIELTADEIKEMNKYIASENRLLLEDQTVDQLDASDAGMNHLNGKQALAYCRDRYTGNDFSRTAHQREVMMAIYDEIKDQSIVELNQMVETFLPQITTDLSYGDCLYLLSLMPGIKDYTIDSFSLPVKDTYSFATIDDMSVLVIDYPANLAYWEKAVNGSEQ